MTTINLKDFYYWYTQDQFIEVSDEVAEVFLADARYEMAYQRRLSRHKAQYSLAVSYTHLKQELTDQEAMRLYREFHAPIPASPREREKPPSAKQRVRLAILAALAKKPTDFADFLRLMRSPALP